MFALGCAQLGSHYGIASEGMLSHDDAVALVREAWRLGVRVYDTAQSYGNGESERIVGEALRGLPATIITKTIDGDMRGSVAALGPIDTVLLHRWENAPFAIPRLMRARSDGLVRTIGASVQSPREMREALGWPEIMAIQFPLNILDWRWEVLIDEAIKCKVWLYARSIFLQGLIPLLGQHSVMRRAGRIDNRCNIRKLCIAHVKAYDITTVIGADSVGQLRDNVQQWRTTRGLRVRQINKLRDMFARTPEPLLNPAMWISSPPIAQFHRHFGPG